MKIGIPKSKNRKKYDLFFSNFSLGFNEQLELHKKLSEIMNKIPSDSFTTLRFSKKKDNLYQANVLIKSSTFGCNLSLSSKGYTDLSNKIFENINDEVKCWRKSKYKSDYLAPYFGGYPSYYAERIVS